MINMIYCWSESGFTIMAIWIFYLYAKNEKTFYIDAQVEIQAVML